MPPSPEQVAALLSKYKATTERVVRERDRYKAALTEIAHYDDFFNAETASAMMRIAREALSVTRPQRCPTCGGLGQIVHESGGYGIDCPDCTRVSSQERQP